MNYKQKDNILNFNKKAKKTNRQFIAIFIPLILILFFIFNFQNKIFNKKNSQNQSPSLVYKKELNIKIPNFHKIKYDYQTNRYVVENSQDKTLLWSTVNKLDKNNARILIISPYLVNSAFREADILSVGVFNNWDWYINEIDNRTILYSATVCPYGNDNLYGKNVWVEPNQLAIANLRYNTNFTKPGCYYIDLKNQKLIEEKKYKPTLETSTVNNIYSYLMGNIDNIDIDVIKNINPDLIIMDSDFKKYFAKSYNKVKTLDLEIFDFDFLTINDFTLFLSSFGYHLGNEDKINLYFQQLNITQDLFREQRTIDVFKNTLFLTYKDEKLYLKNQDFTNTIQVLSNGKVKYATSDKELTWEQIARFNKKHIIIIYQKKDKFPLYKRIEYRQIFNHKNLSEPIFIENYGFYDLEAIKKIDEFIQIL